MGFPSCESDLGFRRRYKVELVLVDIIDNKRDANFHVAPDMLLKLWDNGDFGIRTMEWSWVGEWYNTPYIHAVFFVWPDLEG